MKAVFFCEDDYEGCQDIESESDFASFEVGFTLGANAYGAGKVRVYLLPRDHDAMREAEHVGEVMRALKDAEP